MTHLNKVSAEYTDGQGNQYTQANGKWFTAILKDANGTAVEVTKNVPAQGSLAMSGGNRNGINS